MKKGLLIVNTGNGKGKTTAALGQTMRTLGHGFNVCFVQFIKGSWKYGELESVKKFAGQLDFHVTGKGFTFRSNDLEEDKKKAREGWTLAKGALADGKYFLVVLDELTYLMNFGVIPAAEVMEAIGNRPENMHVIVTGRDAPPELIDAADLVTEMTEVRHPLASGVKGQRGIEF